MQPKRSIAISQAKQHSDTVGHTCHCLIGAGHGWACSAADNVNTAVTSTWCGMSVHSDWCAAAAPVRRLGAR